MKKRIALFGALAAVVAVLVFASAVPSNACTLAGVTGAGTFQHEVFIGQTMDNAWWPTRHTVWVIQPEDGGYKYLGTKAAIWGFWTGINEKGFAWVGAAVGANDTPSDAPDAPGLLEIGPALLERCTTVYDAIAYLQSHPRKADFPTRNALMADAQGNLALVEIGYSHMHVETLTTNGYVVSTNQFVSPEMLLYSHPGGADSLDRMARGEEWFENWFAAHHAKGQNKLHIQDLFSPLNGLWSYVYETRQNNMRSGPGTVGVMDPMQLTYWFAYGWPGGNLPTKENEGYQICQKMSWGAFIPFHLKEMVPGQYTTELGQLTPLGVQYVVSHFSDKLQSTPAWVNYQSDNPMAPYYKPAEDMSPSGYTKQENPFGPGGLVGTWSGSMGFLPCPECQ